MTTMTDVHLRDVIKSPRTLTSLYELGYKMVSDVAHLSVDELMKIRWVGQGAVKEIQKHVDLSSKGPNDGEIEEGIHDLILHSPNPGQMIILLSGEKIGDRMSGFKVLQGVYVQCRNGHGVISRRMWLTKKHHRDQDKIDADEKSNAPWRIDAADWLKRRKSYGRAYFILEDS